MTCKTTAYALDHNVKNHIRDWYSYNPDRGGKLTLEFEVDIIVQCTGSCPDIASNACPMMPPGHVDIEVEVGEIGKKLFDAATLDLLKKAYKRAKAGDHRSPSFYGEMTKAMADNPDFLTDAQDAAKVEVDAAIAAALKNALYFDYCRCASAFSADYEAALAHNKNFFTEYNKTKSKLKFY